MLIQGEKLMDVELSYHHLVDDKLIWHRAGCVRELKRPEKYSGNPILYPSEEAGEQYVSGQVLWDGSENKFVMWYTRTLFDGSTTLHYATSDNGIDWEYPSLGLYEENGSKDNNVLADENGEKICPKACIFLNPREEPGKKFVGIFQPWHYYYGYSADGICWQVDMDNPVWLRGSGDGLGECMSFLYDPIEDIWRAYVRVWVNNCSKRTTGYGESKDMLSWTGPKIIYAADDEWGLGAQVYSWSPWFEDGKYWALAHMFFNDLHPDPRRHQTLLPTLIYSEDGLNWHAVEKGEFFIPLGRPGQWDGMMITAGRPIIKDGKAMFYYAGYVKEHGSTRNVTGRDQRVGMGLAIGGQGRYAALKSLPDQQAVLTTKPFVLRGDQLSVNARTAKEGWVKAEIIDSAGSIIPGLGIADCCDGFAGDAVDALMSWGTSTTALRQALGENVWLRLRWSDAELFGFQFHQSGPDIAELSAGPLPVSCRKTNTPPVIDGVLDDEVWENFGVIGTVDKFVLFDRTDPAPVKTTVHVTYDDEALYFAFNLEEPGTDRLVADRRQGDPDVFNDDAMQIELQPSGREDGDLSVLIFNSQAVKTTIMIDPKRAHSSRHDTSPAWEVATSVSKGCWDAEVKVPFEVLEVEPPKSGDRWRLNLHRFRYAELDKGEVYSWVCTFGQFHRHDKRGELRFG